MSGLETERDACHSCWCPWSAETGHGTHVNAPPHFCYIASSCIRGLRLLRPHRPPPQCQSPARTGIHRLYLESQWLMIMGYFKPIMIYFGVQRPVISSYLAVQVDPAQLCNAAESAQTSAARPDGTWHSIAHLIWKSQRAPADSASMRPTWRDRGLSK